MYLDLDPYELIDDEYADREKDVALHLERKACVYVRQSSLAQVRHHQESGRRQRGFKDRAVDLGWQSEQVEIIDEDQGQSGSSTKGREGFKRPVAEVRLGEVGAVFGLEVSRLDPDERVRETITLFFDSFKRLGTALSVARHFEACRQTFPRRDGWGSMDVAPTWGKLSVSRAVAVLRNPTYAGIYAYDRHHCEEMDAEDPCAGGRILISDSHPGYITEDQYERNVARLVSNRSYYRGMKQKGSAREGGCLLTGIVLCGRCGRGMSPAYLSKSTPLYTCYTSATHHRCQQVHARHVDPTVEQVVLATLSKADLTLAVGAMEKLAERSMSMERQWQKRLEAARYETERAARRYHQVEPENRLVVRTLEREWNECLLEAEQVKKEHEEACRKPPISLSRGQRERVLALSKDLPRLFRASTTKVSQKKEILRLLIHDVTLTNRDDPWGIEVAIRWKTGVASFHHAERPQRHPQTTSQEALDRIQALYLAMTDKEVARVLNREGLTSSAGPPFTASIVRSLRASRRWMKRKRRGSNR